ncbi:MAG: DNA replication/repair protein RecF [bacterium]
MYIKNLKINNFRNISLIDSDFACGINIFCGRNGSGKTNLLEAIFVLCLGRSHRGTPELLLPQEGKDVYHIAGQIEKHSNVYEVTVAYKKGERKKITIDKNTVKIVDLYQTHCIVAVGPEDTQILSGPPLIRRSFLNLYLAQFSRNYLVWLSDYHRILAQKNACLKSDSDPSPFNDLLVPVGAEIMMARYAFIQKMHPAVSRYYADISDGGRFDMEYQPSVPLEGNSITKHEVEYSFRTALEQNQHREQIVKTAIVGPHRDDIMFRIGGLPARTHGSRGEWRTAAIALKLAVFHLLKAQCKTEPILLLDEVFTELDQQRTNGLIHALGDFGQLFLTTAVDPPDILKQDSCCYRIHNGAIQDIS